MCVFLWFCCFFSLFSVTIPCFQSLLSLPQIYWGSMRERWNEVIYFACRCLAVNWVLVVPLVILWHVAVPGWVSLPSVCLVEFLNMFFWVAIHPETGKCVFSKFSYFLSFQSFPPLTPLYQSVFVRALQGWKWALSLLTQLAGLQWVWQRLYAGLVECNYRAATDPKRRCNSEVDRGIFIFAELCSVRVLVTTPKLILLTRKLRMVGFVTFLESQSGLGW